jgi:hypothetical protein
MVKPNQIFGAEMDGTKEVGQVSFEVLAWLRVGQHTAVPPPRPVKSIFFQIQHFIQILHHSLRWVETCKRSWRLHARALQCIKVDGGESDDLVRATTVSYFNKIFILLAN